MAAPPITSVGWWARRWIRLTATAEAKPTLAAVPACESPRTNAVVKAARVWPLGKLLHSGSARRRRGGPRAARRSTAALTTRLTSRDEKPAAASATIARRRSGPPASLQPGQQDPDQPVVGQIGDERGRPVDLRAAPEGLEGGVDCLVEGAHAGRSRGEGGAGGLEVAVVAQGADVGAEVLGVAGPLDGGPHRGGPPALAPDGLLRRRRRDGEGLAQVEQPDLGRGRPSRLSHNRA